MKTGPFDLSGKVAVVTGGNGGIGLGMARGLGQAGAAVAIVGRNEAKSVAAAADLKQNGAKAIFVLADVSDKTAVAATVERTLREFGRIDILVNNAGINIRKPPQALDIEEWDRVIRTNLTSAFLCSQAVHPAMKAAGGGKIINIGSMMSIFGASFAPAYAASKGGIVQFTLPTSRASRYFCHRARRTLSPAPRSPSMAASRCRDRPMRRSRHEKSPGRYRGFVSRGSVLINILQ